MFNYSLKLQLCDRRFLVAFHRSVSSCKYCYSLAFSHSLQQSSVQSEKRKPVDQHTIYCETDYLGIESLSNFRGAPLCVLDTLVPHSRCPRKFYKDSYLCTKSYIDVTTLQKQIDEVYVLKHHCTMQRCQTLLQKWKNLGICIVFCIILLKLAMQEPLKLHFGCILFGYF